MNERILLYYYETSGQLVFVRFSEEIEDTKKTFRNYLTFSQWKSNQKNIFVELIFLAKIYSQLTLVLKTQTQRSR